MKKILFCASRASHIENFHMPYIQYFYHKNYQIDVIAEGEIQSEYIHRNYDLEFTKHFFSPDNIATLRNFEKILFKEEYDIICSNTTLAGTAAKLAVRKLPLEKRPYFVHISHGYMFCDDFKINSLVYRFIEKFTSKVVDCLVVMNREDFSLAKKYHLCKNLHYIYGMGLDESHFPSVKNEQILELKKQLNISENQKILLCVGELSKRKNQKEIIKALYELKKENSDMILLLAGEGTERERYQKLSQKYHLEKDIIFLGQYHQMNLLYHMADLLVSASKMEGLPFNVMEALYCHLPCVLSDIKGHRELLRNGGGVLVCNHSRAIAQQIHDILNHSEYYQSLKNSAVLPEQYLLKNAMPVLIKILENTEDKK